MIGDLTQTGGAPEMTGLFGAGRFVRIGGIGRVDVHGHYSQSTTLDVFGGSAGPGVMLFGEVLDVSAYYRYASLRYRAASTSVVQSGFGGMAMFFPSAELLFTLQSEAITGDDVRALMVFATAMWRPRL
jgi:hypothetical protein